MQIAQANITNIMTKQDFCEPNTEKKQSKVFISMCIYLLQNFHPNLSCIQINKCMPGCREQGH